MINKLYKQALKSGNVYALAGNLIFAVFSFVTFLIMVRVLEKHVYGQWIIFITIASLVDMFRLGLTGTAVIRQIAQSNPEQEKHFIGSSYQLSLVSTLFIAVLFLILFLVINLYNPDSQLLIILKYYPILALVNLPFHQASIVTQGKVNFKRFMILKMINGLLVFLAVNFYLFYNKNISLNGLIIAYIIAFFLSSMLPSMLNWDGIRFFNQGAKNIRKEILKFGKFSTASYIGSNLLRGSDTILLSLASFMGPAAIAIYAIPLKFIELVEIPLRSFTSTAFPRLSKSLQKDKKDFSDMTIKYIAYTTILLIPVVLVLVIFPEFFLKLIGGKEYINEINLQVRILYVVSIYILILPIDRYSGVALFAINRPELNFYKILFMLIANVIFDIIAIYLFHSLFFVAIATVAFTCIGVLFGWILLFRTNNMVLSPKTINLDKHIFFLKRWRFLIKKYSVKTFLK
jgi:O-antigen/teichoic acid export membrane protein